MHASNPEAKFALAHSRPSPRFGALASLVASGIVSFATVSARAEESPVPAPPTVVEPAASPTPIVTPPAVPERSGDRDFWHRNTSGYVGGQFYLRSEDDAFILYPQARLQMDTYGYGGAGVADFQRSDGTGLKAGTFDKRSRVEMRGRFLHDWYFQLSGDFATGNSVAAGQTVKPNAIPTDVWVGFEASHAFALQVGQFDIPFTNENLWTDKFFDFMERSLTVRAVGAPFNKDLGVMARGESGDWGKSMFGYAVAFVGGNGQNRPAIDNRGDVAARVYVRPFMGSGGPMEKAHLGLSARYGQRDPSFIRYDAPGLSTPGGYTFFSSTYKDSAGKTVHILPDAAQSALGFDFFLPIDAFDLKGEVVYLNEGRRESFDDPNNAGTAQGNIERTGSLKGLSYYVQAAYWLMGKPRGNPGDPGIGSLPKRHLEEKPMDHALQLVARFEQMMLTYDSIDRSGGVTDVSRGGKDAVTRDIKVNDFQLAANYWASKHVRVTLEWSMYMFPGTPPADPGFKTAADANLAGGPGSGVVGDDGKTKRGKDASTLHEISFRVAFAI